MRVRRSVATAVAVVLGSAGLAAQVATAPMAQAATESNIGISRVGTGGALGNGFSQTPTVSADGRFVAFHSYATNLVANDTNGLGDIFVKNLATGTNVIVNRATGGALSNAAPLLYPDMSANGRFVAFASAASNLVANDTNTCTIPDDLGGGTEPCVDVFVRDRDTDLDGIFDEAGAVKTVRVSVDDDGGQLFEHSGVTSGFVGERGFAISATGRYVVFTTQDDFLAGGFYDGYIGIYLHDRDTDNDGIFDEAGQIDTKPIANPFERTASWVDISADGRSIVLRTDAQLTGDANTTTPNIYAYDVPSETFRLLDRSTAGAQSNGSSAHPSISDSGRYVTFQSVGTNLVTPADATSTNDIFLVDRDFDGNGTFDETGGTLTTKVSTGLAGALANGPSYSARITANGRFVAYQSQASNLVAGDTGTVDDIFVYDRLTAKNVRRSLDNTGGAPNSGAYEPSTSNDNAITAYWSSATDILATDANNIGDVFARKIAGLVKCNGEVATLVGTSAGETLNGGGNRDIIVGLGGNDTINGRGGLDLICAGSGVDTVSGGVGADVIYGDDGNDILAGNDGNDKIYGGNGNDAMDGGAQTDRCEGGAQITADTATNCETVVGVP